MVKILCKYDKLESPQSLTPFPDNTNAHPPQQIELLGDIIEYQGWRHPIIVSSLSRYIVAGHGRWMVAADRGWTQIPVVYQDFDSKEQEYAFLESDNHIAELSEHNLELMWSNLKDLPELDYKMLGIPDLEMPDVENIGRLKKDKEEKDEDEFTTCPRCKHRF